MERRCAPEEKKKFRVPATAGTLNIGKNSIVRTVAFLGHIGAVEQLVGQVAAGLTPGRYHRPP